eukprot:m.82487 g.82487  ORF g.82487 m.82487 type:complete len:495 (+) comp14615_c0_seq2:77-1561(+)
MDDHTAQQSPHKFIVATQLCSWQDDAVEQLIGDAEEGSNDKPSPFPFDESLNRKLCLWQGEPEQLEIEGLVNANTENFTELSPRTNAVMLSAGPELQNDSAGLRACRTGDVHVTDGYQLAARYLIHTVGPRYNAKYKTAADSALYNCYRNVLESMLEHKISTLGLVTIHNYNRDYPIAEGGHLALRVVRRFLERFADKVDTIVLICNDLEYQQYKTLLPIYFPRTTAEEGAAARLVPDDIGNEFGEPVIDERNIRIATALGQSEDDERAVIEDVDFDARAFATMSADFDKARLNKLKHHSPQPTNKQERDRALYQTYLRSAPHTDFSELQERKLVHIGGEDHAGARVLVFTGRQFRAHEQQPELLLHYLISVMDPVVKGDYTIVYLHTQVTGEQRPDTTLFKRLAELADDRYMSNLSRIFVVHPSWWTKVTAWFVGTFALPAHVKEKITYIDSLQQLYDYVTESNLQPPKFVLEWDQKKFPHHHTAANNGSDTL